MLSMAKPAPLSELLVVVMTVTLSATWVFQRAWGTGTVTVLAPLVVNGPDTTGSPLRLTVTVASLS